MGKTEEESVQMQLVAYNDVKQTFGLLSLDSHDFVQYYLEEFEKDEFVFHNMFINLACFIKKRLERCTSYCICCWKKLIDESARVSPCTQPFCMFKFEEIFGVKLYSEIQSNLPLIQLDLSIASKAIFSSRVLDIFEPFPSFFLKHQEERERSVFGSATFTEAQQENKDIEQMKSILNSFPKLTDISDNAKSEVIHKTLFNLII